MIVTEIKSINNKYEVYIDESIAFRLYKKEIKRYNITEDMIVDEGFINQVLTELIIPRGMVYTGHLLGSKDYTEYQIRQKLVKASYSESAIEIILDKLKGYGFINDHSYVERYYEYKKDKLSYFDITNKLYKKGISKELIRDVLEKDNDLEEEALRKCINKKMRNINVLDTEKKNKLIRHLLYKGYPYEKIKCALDNYTC